ncbi:MAG: hypothetical protein FIA99_16470 [Ruminiclostridium sp.]|nr:hypothetical protein [Ruminiclostridium sp.]
MPDQSASYSINEIAEKYNIEFLVHFGSFQTEFYKRESDIDIAFLSGKQLDIDRQVKLLEDLVVFHRKSEMDLVDLRKAEPILRYEIAKSGRVLFEKEKGLFERYSLFYIKRFYELKPVIEEELRLIGKSINEVIANDR